MATGNDVIVVFGLMFILLMLAGCNTTGAGCITYGQYRADVPVSPEFAVLDTAMTRACHD